MKFTLDSFKWKIGTLKLCFLKVFSCLSSVGNLDFQDFLKKMFYITWITGQANFLPSLFAFLQWWYLKVNIDINYVPALSENLEK